MLPEFDFERNYSSSTLSDLAALNSPLCVFVCGSGFSLVTPSA